VSTEAGFSGVVGMKLGSTSVRRSSMDRALWFRCAQAEEAAGSTPAGAAMRSSRGSAEDETTGGGDGLWELQADALQRVGDGWGFVVRGERNRVLVTLAYATEAHAKEAHDLMAKVIVGAAITPAPIGGAAR
jgi:hypothetical protein